MSAAVLSTMENMTAHKYIALIPAYKPLALLPNLVSELTRSGMTVVLVDDGSGAEFGEIFKACAQNAKICTHAKNMGKGVALKTGLEYILNTYGEDNVVVTVDADGQHEVKDALAVCEIVENHPHTLVFGSRMFTGKVPFKSRVGNTLTQVSFHIFSGVSMYDTQTGLRAFSGDLIPKLLDISGERYEYEMNMLFDFTKERIPIIEHEIATIYENNNESSHFNPIKDTLSLHVQIFKAWAYSFAVLLSDYVLFAVAWLISGNTVIANTIARVISAPLRFVLNRKFGFKSRHRMLVSMLNFVFATVCIFALNTIALFLLVDVWSVNGLLAKLIVGAIGLLLSWAVKKVATIVAEKKRK